MGYSEWIIAKRRLYTTAITNAYNNRDADPINNLKRAWQEMSGAAALSGLLPTNTVFYGGSPTATEANITTFENWLNANPTEAGYLNLKNLGFTNSSDASGRKNLGNAGNVSTEKRKWKGAAQYTFANGILIGKNNKIVAAIGTDGKSTSSTITGYGTDTLIYFDGVPGSKGTGLPGTTVFGGDMVVSGSIQGQDGIIIIDDVIQLEQNVSNPAAIGVDSAGKIRLRHRGEGFLDLIDEDEKKRDEIKRWVGTQNTSSARYGTSLIPNSQFSLLEPNASGTYSEQVANIATIGAETTILAVTPSTDPGIIRLPSSGAGIVFQAIPTASERYAIRIRFKGSVVEEINDNAASEGLFLEFHETTTEDISGTSTAGVHYIYHTGAMPGATKELTKASEFYIDTSKITVTRPTGSSSTDSGSNLDGISVGNTNWNVKTFVYTRSSTDIKNASLVIYTKNYAGTIDVDYIVMTESPMTATEIRAEAVSAAADIVLEVDNAITDAKMSDVSNWAKLGANSTITNSTDGEVGGDQAVLLSITAATSGTDGILSSPTSCDSDKYLIGVRIKALNNTTASVKLLAVENTVSSFSTMTPTPSTPLTSLIVSGRNSVNTIIVDDAGGETSSSASQQSVPDNNADIEVHGDWVNILGTYTATTTISASPPYTVTTPSQFCLGLEVSSFSIGSGGTNCELLIDYFYCKPQSASGDLAALLADEAYGDAEGFVTATNELLVKEQGSILYNANMAHLSSTGIPVAYKSPNTLTLEKDNSDRQIKVASSSGTRYLISPPFQFGSADKFSIGIRAKATAGTPALTAEIHYLGPSDGDGSGQLTDTASTVAHSSVGDLTSVGVINAGVSKTLGTTTLSPSNLSTSYVSLLGTWERNPIDLSTNTLSNTGAHNSKLGALVISCASDFIVDYILIKEQLCSFDLASATAQLSKDEAIAQTATILDNLGEAITQETGSMIANPGFNTHYLNGGDPATAKQRPTGWLTTRDASNPLRVIPAFESPASNAEQKNQENVVNVLQTGSAIKFTPGASTGGILSRFIQLPLTTTWINTNTTPNTTVDVTGAYNITVRVRLSSAEPVGIRLRAHEYNSLAIGAQTHVMVVDGSYGSNTVEGANIVSSANSDVINVNNGSTGQIVRIGPINLTTPDTTAGYDPEGDGYASATDQYVEYIPVDNVDLNSDGDTSDANENETEGDKDSVAGTFATWYVVGGSYKPTSTAKLVSFEIIIDSNPDSDSNRPDIYIDYVNLTPQPFDADFAQTVAEGRIEGIVGVTSVGGTVAGSYIDNLNNALVSSISGIETGLNAESDSLIPNGNFLMAAGSKAKHWIPTGRNATYIQLVTNQVGSIGTAAAFTTDSSGDDICGIVSKAILSPASYVNQGNGQFGRFNFGMRIRGSSSTTAAGYTQYTYSKGSISNPTAVTAGHTGATSTTKRDGDLTETGDTSGYPANYVLSTPSTNQSASTWEVLNGSSFNNTSSDRNPTFGNYDWESSNGNAWYHFQTNEIYDGSGFGTHPTKFVSYDTPSVNDKIHLFLYAPFHSVARVDNLMRLYVRLAKPDDTAVSNQSNFKVRISMWAQKEDGTGVTFLQDASSANITETLATYDSNNSSWYVTLKQSGQTPQNNYYDGIVCVHVTKVVGNPSFTTSVGSPDSDYPVSELTLNGSGSSTRLHALNLWFANAGSSTTRASDWYFHSKGLYSTVAQIAQTTTVFPPTDSEFKIRVIANETTEGLSNTNVAIIKSSDLGNSSTIDTDVGITAFTTNVTTQNLSIIDLKWSGSSASLDTDGDGVPDDGFILVTSANQDTGSGESITDWREIYGSYKPSSMDVTAVSFHLQIDSDPSLDGIGDGDGVNQSIFLDSMYLTESAVDEDLATTISDNRVFVEQNFQGGTTPVSPNNVIKNADMSQVQQITHDSQNLKIPLGFTYTTDKSSFSWDDNEFLISPASTVSNRAIRIVMTNGVDASAGDKNGIATSPFRITHSKYKIRLVMNATAVYAGDWSMVALCTNTTLSTVASVIKDTTAVSSADYWWTNGVSDASQVSLAGTFARQEFHVDQANISTSPTVYEFEWSPMISHSSIGRPTNAELPEYASLHFFVDLNGESPSAIDVWEFSAEPTGQPYPSADMAGIQYALGADFDSENDILPGAPRETEAKVAQLKAIDVELSAETSGASYTATKDCLVMAMPRKYYNSNSGTTVSGKSYIAPGVSDLKYEQDGNYTWGANDDTVGSRKLVFPALGKNSIENIDSIRFNGNYWNDGAYKISTNSGNSIKIEGTKTNNSDIPLGSPVSMRLQEGGYGIQFNRRNDVTLTTYDTDGSVLATTNTNQPVVFIMNPEAGDYVNNTSYGAGRYKQDNCKVTIDLGTTTSLKKQIGYFWSDDNDYEFTFTGQHWNRPAENTSEFEVGLIVVSTGTYKNISKGQSVKPTINESLPTVVLSSSRKQKSVWGVVSYEEDDNETTRNPGYGAFKTTYKKEEDDNRLCINSLGEGGIWVCNINGNLENGDYITTCEIPGYGMKQDDDILHNYTVAKITQDCNFRINAKNYDVVEFEHEGQTYRKAFVGCTYHCG